MTALVVGLILTALIMSLVGSFAPVFPAEAYVVAVALAQPAGVEVAVALAAGLGQTLGKVAVLVSTRAAVDDGSRLHRLLVRVARATLASRPQPTPGRWAQLTGRTAALVSGGHRWVLTRMGGRARGPVVLLGAAVGLPPLLAVTVYAGAAGMRLLPFALTCVAGRSARMVAVALLAGLAPVAASGAL